MKHCLGEPVSFWLELGEPLLFRLRRCYGNVRSGVLVETRFVLTVELRASIWGSFHQSVVDDVQWHL